MASVKLKFVHAYMASGRTYYYFRRKGFPKVRLPDNPSSAEFAKAYERLLVQAGDMSRFTHEDGTLGALITAFKASPEFTQDIKPKTQKGYERYLLMLEKYNDLPADYMTRRWILEKRDSLSDRPRTANYFMQTVRRLYSFGMDRGIVTSNPASKPKMLKQKGRYRAWADNECDQFEASNPPLPILRAYMLAVHTGQRQGDVLRMTWNQYDGAVIRLWQGKTQDEDIDEPLVIPVRDVLREFLDNQERDGLLIVKTKTGKQYLEDHFRHQFRKALNAAGLTHLQFHGLRHTMGKRLAEADANVKSILGQKTDAMALHYSSAANQSKLAHIAIEKLDRK